MGQWGGGRCRPGQTRAPNLSRAEDSWAVTAGVSPPQKRARKSFPRGGGSPSPTWSCCHHEMVLFCEVLGFYLQPKNTGPRDHLHIDGAQAYGAEGNSVVLMQRQKTRSHQVCVCVCV